MGKFGLLEMKTSDDVSTSDLRSDFQEVGVAMRKLANHTVGLLGTGLLTSLLQWLATIAAIYLLVLDRTNWRTNMLTSLLVPYIFLNLPSLIFNIFRGEIGKWIAFVAVVLRLFFPRHFPGESVTTAVSYSRDTGSNPAGCLITPREKRTARKHALRVSRDWLEMPGSLILLLVVTPHLIVEIRGWWIGVIISLIIGAYLLQEHIRKNGGFRNAFAERRGVSNTIGIILLFISPLWELIKLVL